MGEYYSSPRLSRFAFWVTLAAFNRRRELNRLVLRARAKGYQQPLRLYRTRLKDEEVRLNRYSLHYPRATTFAYIVHQINGILFPSPRYFRTGAASHYNRSFLTGIQDGL